MMTDQKYHGTEIAIIGMACRFPGARNRREFWTNLANAVESIDMPAGHSFTNVDGYSHFVPATVNLPSKDNFDYPFFDYRQAEANLMNPAHRVFLECVWEALEDASCPPGEDKNRIGVFAGAGDDFNWKLYSMLANKEQEVDDFTLRLLNNKDYLASLISYKLQLSGPSVSINTACSTSLVATHLACKSLLLGESNIAIAGGVSITTEKRAGYFYQQSMIYSADGHCRAFDKNASGTIVSEGAGVVVLKRLNDALRDKDHIYALIKGSAINNDGNRKVGYTAPSVMGQAECIRMAQKFARVSPESITYIEAHGTATRLGDPVEVEALNLAFNNNKSHSCLLGAVKSNIGHASAAAGVAGLIKTVLCLQHRQIVPSLHYTEPNPEINFEGGPFSVNTQLSEWPETNGPRRAGVSSFGIGGTNAHIILEEAFIATQEQPASPFQLVGFSAGTRSSLLRYTQELKEFLLNEPDIDLANLCYSLHTGRKHHAYRFSMAVQNKESLIAALGTDAASEYIVNADAKLHAAVFMFPGQGSQYAGMGRQLYEAEPLFRAYMDEGFAIAEQFTGTALKELFLNSEDVDVITETRHAQPLIFLVEYALAKLMIGIGITPKYMIGHSIGEYAAACISGVFSLEDALRLVLKRGELMDRVAGGAMISVSLPENEATAYLNPEIFVAAVNSPAQTVLSGKHTAIHELIKVLEQQHIPYVKLRTSHAFHSGMFRDIYEAFLHEAKKVHYHSIQYPFISNVSGTFIKQSEASSPEYWARHILEPVRFSEGVRNLLAANESLAFIEAGPGSVLKGLVKQHGINEQHLHVNLLQSSKHHVHDKQYFAAALGQLWSNGVFVNWKAYYKNQPHRKIPLPTYCFEPFKCPTEVDPLQMIALQETSVAMGRQFVAPDISFNHSNSDVVTAAAKTTRRNLSAEFAAPASEIEVKLVNMWQAFFEIDRVGIDDDFFEMGGDSLRAMVFLKRVEKEWEAIIPLQDFFAQSTIRKLALSLENILWLRSGVAMNNEILI